MTKGCSKLAPVGMAGVLRGMARVLLGMPVAPLGMAVAPLGMAVAPLGMTWGVERLRDDCRGDVLVGMSVDAGASAGASA
ncbi:MAG: hypothetical protein U0893_09860 [Chloroflexota bacterium]